MTGATVAGRAYIRCRFLHLRPSGRGISSGSNDDTIQVLDGGTDVAVRKPLVVTYTTARVLSVTTGRDKLTPAKH